MSKYTVLDLMPYLQQEATARGTSAASMLIAAKLTPSDAVNLEMGSGGLLADEETQKRMWARALATNALVGGGGRTDRSGSTEAAQNVEAAAEKGSQLRAQAAGLMAGITGDMRKNTTASNSAGISAAEAAGKQHLLDADVEIRKIDQAQSIMSQFGIMPGRNDAVLKENQQRLAAADEAMRALQPAIADAQSQSPLTNLFGWLGGQVKLMELVPKYNAAATEHARARNAISTAHQLAANQKALQPALEEDNIRAKARLAASIEMYRATAEARKNDNALLMHEINLQQTLVSMSDRDLQHASLVAGLRADLETKAAKEIEDKEEAKLKSTVDYVMRLSGGAQKTMLDIKSMERKDRELVVGSLGTNGSFRSFGDGVTVVELVGSKESLVAAGQKAEVVWIDEAKQLADKKYAKEFIGSKLTPVEIQIASLNKLADEWKKEAANRDYTKLSKGNPYRPNFLLMANEESLEGNRIAQHVRDSWKDAKQVLTEKDVMAYATGLIRVDPKQADKVVVEFHDLMTKGYTFQHAKLATWKYGFDAKNPESKKLEIPIINPFQEIRPFSGEKVETIDMLNPAKMKNILLREVTADLARTNLDQKAKALRDKILQGQQPLPDPNQINSMPRFGQ
jgi:hypothetical protein